MAKDPASPLREPTKQDVAKLIAAVARVSSETLMIVPEFIDEDGRGVYREPTNNSQSASSLRLHRWSPSVNIYAIAQAEAWANRVVQSARIGLL